MKMRGHISHHANAKEHAFFENAIVRFLLIIGVILDVTSVCLLEFLLSEQQSYAVIHYNVYFGIDLIGERWQAFILPIFSFVLYVLNMLLAHRLYGKKERIASYLLLITSVLLGVGTLVASAGIILINY